MDNEMLVLFHDDAFLEESQGKQLSSAAPTASAGMSQEMEALRVTRMGYGLASVFFSSCLENTCLVTFVWSEFKDTACLTKCVTYVRHLKWPQPAISAGPHADLVISESSVPCFLVFV